MGELDAARRQQARPRRERDRVGVLRPRQRAPARLRSSSCGGWAISFGTGSRSRGSPPSPAPRPSLRPSPAREGRPRRPRLRTARRTSGRVSSAPVKAERSGRCRRRYSTSPTRHASGTVTLPRRVDGTSADGTAQRPAAHRKIERKEIQLHSPCVQSFAVMRPNTPFLVLIDPYTRIVTAARSAVKCTRLTSPRSSPSTWRGIGASHRAKTSPRSWP